MQLVREQAHFMMAKSGLKEPLLAFQQWRVSACPLALQPTLLFYSSVFYFSAQLLSCCQALWHGISPCFFFFFFFLLLLLLLLQNQGSEGTMADQPGLSPEVW